jgi:adenylosuccinate lyase
MDLSALTALSPIDGRYADKSAALRPYTSEFALIRYRVLVEVRWLQHLGAQPGLPEVPALTGPANDLINELVDEFGMADAQRVKALEASTNHDVKAVEYFLRERLSGSADFQALQPFIHFACTSEDINNLAYALSLRDARSRVLDPAMTGLLAGLKAMAGRWADLPMLSRTHGQPASPTTMGKELANVAYRLQAQQAGFAAVAVQGKMNGAVGNFNAHVAAYPEVDWPAVASAFVESLGVRVNPFTTQIEPHDWMAAYCHALSRYNTVLIDLCRDIWAYISIGYFSQQLVAGEVGSSTMPHKVNPIDFENAEGNLGVANALLGFLADKLPRSRWQRDLTDSTVLRNLGVTLGHCAVAYQSVARGLTKLQANPDVMAADLDANWEVLAEAIQTVMRKHGVADAYEQLKALTRGQQIDAEALQQFVAGLKLPAAAREQLAALTPHHYLGLAAKLTRRL